MNAEAVALTRAVAAGVEDIRVAIRQALPGNPALHAEFGVGEPVPADVAALVALSRRVEPLARQYRSLLLSRGIDAARLEQLAQMTATLERVAPPPAPAEAAPAGRKASEKKPAVARARRRRGSA